MWQVIPLEAISELSCEDGMWQRAPTQVSLLHALSKAQMEFAEARKCETSRKCNVKFLFLKYM